jgi:dihydroorotate dehydrogenase electron transfer subunit
MLKAIKAYAYEKDVPAFISLEERMACGIGACYGCVINTKNGLKRVCKDGPIFKLGEVAYD